MSTNGSVVDGHPAGSDVGELGVAVGAASVLVAAQRGPGTGDGTESDRSGTVHVMRVAHHKLVRDQIPAIITADGGQPVTRGLDDAGYEAALRAKLLEEAHEAFAALCARRIPAPSRSLAT